jgi:hypothetical protein
MRLQIQAVVYLLLLATSGATPAEDAPKLKHAIPTDAVQFVTAFSPDSQAVTIAFGNLLIGTESGTRVRLPSVQTNKFTYVLQPESSKEVYVTQDIRGFVTTSGSGSASLVIHSGGKTSVVDLKKAIEEARGGAKKATSETHGKALNAAREKGFTSGEAPEEGHNFFTRIETRVPAGRPLQTTVFLLVDRLTGDDGSEGLLTVDTIDAEVHPLPAKSR